MYPLIASARFDSRKKRKEFGMIRGRFAGRSLKGPVKEAFQDEDFGAKYKKRNS